MLSNPMEYDELRRMFNLNNVQLKKLIILGMEKYPNLNLKIKNIIKLFFIQSK